MPWAHTADLLLDVAEGKGSGGAADGTHAGQRTLAALADCLRIAARKLYVFCGNPNYNLVVRNPPFSARHAEWYHWHIELAPIFSKKGGLEYGTHCMVLMMAPETAARNLRETLVDGEDDDDATRQGESPDDVFPPASPDPGASSPSERVNTIASSVSALNEFSVSALGSIFARVGSVSALDSFTE